MAKKNRLKFEAPDLQPDGTGTPPVKLQNLPRRQNLAEPDDTWAILDDAVALGLGLLCVFLPRIVEPGIRDLFQLPKQLLMANGAAAALVVLAVLSFLGRPLRMPKTPLLWPGLALCASIALGVAIAPEQTGGVLSIFARYDAHRWAAAAVLFATALVGLGHPRRLWYVIGGIALGGLWVALIGIGEQHNIKAFLPNEKWAIISKPGSTFGNRNMAAELIVAVMPACYALLAMGLRWWVHGKRMAALVLSGISMIALLLLVYYLMLTVTRSAWAGAFLGLVGAAAAWGIGRLMAGNPAPPVAEHLTQTDPSTGGSAPPLQPRNLGLFGVPPARLLAPVLAGFLLFGGVAVLADVLKPGSEQIDEGDAKRGKSVPALIKSFFDQDAQAYAWRIGMWASSWDAMKAEPLGGGAGNWRVMYPKYVTQREKNDMFNIAKQPIRAHQDFLQFGVEFGFHGLLALLTLIGMSFWLTCRAVAKAATPREGQEEASAWYAFCSLASLAGVIAICGDAMASFPLQLPAPTFIFAVHLAIIGAAEAWLSRRPMLGEPALEPGQKPQPVATMAPGPVPTSLKVVLTASALLSIAFLSGLHDRWRAAEVGFTRGRSLQKQGQPGQGLAEIRKAIAINPDDFQNHFIEALNLNSMGKTKEAIESIERSLILYPNLLNAWVNVAMFSARIGDDKKMNHAIDTALKLKPDELVALNVRAGWLAGQGKHKEVAALLDRHAREFGAYRLSPLWPSDDTGKQLFAHYTSTLGHITKAATKAQMWPQAAEYWTLYVREEIPNDGRTDAAKRDARVERLVPLAEALQNSGRAKEALPHLKLAAELVGDTRADVKRRYAVALAQAGELATAAHEIGVTLRIDGGERDTLVQELEALQKAQPTQATALGGLVELAKAQ